MKTFIYNTSDKKLVEHGRKVFSELEPKTDYVISIKKNRPIKSIKHNRYYRIVIKTIALHTGETEDRLHTLFKTMFNYEEFELPNGDIRRISKSTSGLSDLDFSKYINQVKQFAIDEWACVFMDRHDVDRMQEMDIENRYEKMQG